MTSTVAARETREPSIFDLRRTARRRAWICPGAGFALLGYQRWAVLTFWSGLAAMLVALWTAWSPSAAAFCTLLLLVVLSGVTWLTEIWTTYFAWPTQPGSTASRRYRLGGAAIVALTVLLVVVVTRSYGVISVEEDGMAPKVHPGERLLFRAGVGSDDLERGKLILFKLAPESKYGEPDTLVLARILAVPDDLLEMRHGRYYVNDRAEGDIATAGEDLISLIIMKHPSQTLVPKNCYFVVQDSPDGGHDSRILWWARRENIISTRFWSLNRLPPLSPIK